MTTTSTPIPNRQGYQTFINEPDQSENLAPEEMENLRNNRVPSGSPTTEPTSTFNNKYEELMKGSEQCPTCRGLGRIPENEAEQLVALIPVGDKRLKPRRTVQWVLLSVFVCCLIASLTLFFLFPRNVRAISNQPYLQPVELGINVTTQYVFLSFVNRYNFSNENYIPVAITGITMSVQYDMRILNKATNTTELVIPQLSQGQHYVSMNLTLTGDEGYLAKFCNDPRRWVHDMFMQFEMTANYSYFGHIEQTSLTTYQHVSCGNDTKQPFGRR